MFTVKNKKNNETNIQSQPLEWDEFFKKIKEDKDFRESVGASKSEKLSLEKKGQIYSLYLASVTLNNMEKYKSIGEEDKQTIIRRAAEAMFEDVKSEYFSILREKKNKKVQAQNPT